MKIKASIDASLTVLYSGHVNERQSQTDTMPLRHHFAPARIQRTGSNKHRPLLALLFAESVGVLWALGTPRVQALCTKSQ